MADLTRRPTRHIVLAASAVVLAACAGIPTSGTVEQAGPVDPVRQPHVRTEPEPPDQGAGPVDVVQGFFDAMKSYVPDYPTAREYLTPDASAEWNPDESTTIYQSEPVATPTGDGEVTATVTVRATIDDVFGYARAEPGRSEQYDFRLEQVGGEWRIATPPEGLLVSDIAFDNDFEPFNLFFYDPQFEALVPDHVYLPTRSGPVATLVAQALLAGPSEWLSPAVETAFPEGTQLAVDAVAVTGGEAEVKLTEEAVQGVTTEQRQRMVEQLAWTMGQVEGITEIDVTAGAGVPLVEPNPRAIRDHLDSDPVTLRGGSLFALSDGGVVRVDEAGPTPVRGPLGGYDEGALELAVDPVISRAVVVGPEGNQLVWAPFSDNEELAILADGTSFGSVAWDRHGLVWAVDQHDDESEVIVARPGGEGPQPVEIKHAGVPVEELRIHRLAVALDGTRVAIVAERPGQDGSDTAEDASAEEPAPPDDASQDEGAAEPEGADEEATEPEEGDEAEDGDEAGDGDEAEPVLPTDLGDRAIYLGAVTRDPARPDVVQIEGLRPVSAARLPGTPIDVSWSRFDELAVLVHSAQEETTRAYVIALDTLSAHTAGQVAPDALAIAANWRVRQGLVVGTQDRVQQQQQQLGWDDLQGIRAPTYPG